MSRGLVYWSSVCFGELKFSTICYIVVWYNLLFYSLVQFGGNGCWEEERCRWERGDRTTTSISNACNAALLYVRSSCNSRTCAAHKYVPTFTHAGQFSAVVLRRSPFVIMYWLWDCVHPCLGTTANSLRGVNFQQTQTSRKAITNVNYSPKFQNFKAHLPRNFG